MTERCMLLFGYVTNLVLKLEENHMKIIIWSFSLMRIRWHATQQESL